VTYSTSGLAAGTHGATITVSDPAASNNPQTVTVTLTVTAPPQIVLSTNTLTQSVKRNKDADAQSFTVSNGGGGTLEYAISDDAGWLSCAPASGTSTGEADTVTVNYSTSGLAVGVYTATITVSDPDATNSPRTVTVSMNVYKPGKISATVSEVTASCTVGGSPSEQEFAVWNSGEETMSYAISPDAAWVAASPASGESAGEQDAISVSFGASGLSAGTYTGSLVITSDDADNSPVSIPVTLTVSAGGGGGGGGGGGCSLGGAADPAGWLLPYLGLALIWLVGRYRSYRSYRTYT
jgi:hypothetical protein